jgi:hypothetical protein
VINQEQTHAIMTMGGFPDLQGKFSLSSGKIFPGLICDLGHAIRPGMHAIPTMASCQAA